MKSDLFKHLQMFACVAMLVMGVACSKPAVYTEALSEQERAAVVAGMVMGMDLSVALAGGPPLNKKNWEQLQTGFDLLIKDCKTVQCVTDRMVAFRERVRMSTIPSREFPEIIR